MAPTAGLEAAVKRKIPALAGNRIVMPTLARPSLSPVLRPNEQNVTRSASSLARAATSPAALYVRHSTYRGTI